MREFLARIGANDRVLLIGDIRQHQGVEAGRPFEQLTYGACFCNMKPTASGYSRT